MRRSLVIPCAHKTFRAIATASRPAPSAGPEKRIIIAGDCSANGTRGRLRSEFAPLASPILIHESNWH